MQSYKKMARDVKVNLDWLLWESFLEEEEPLLGPGFECQALAELEAMEEARACDYEAQELAELGIEGMGGAPCG